MEFRFDDTLILEQKSDTIAEHNSYLILSKEAGVKDADLNKVIQIIDESGDVVNCTYNKFVEIFDKEGLAGFIL